MDPTSSNGVGLDGWGWLEAETRVPPQPEEDRLALSFARCFKGSDGAAVIGHLRHVILDRRLGPNASDAELRFLEGQRTVVAHILSMIDRGMG